MTSTPYIILTNRSSQASDRPNSSAAQQGRLAISYGASDPGVYFQDTGGSIRKVGPNHYATTAPNAAPLGLAGNSVGETWVDFRRRYCIRMYFGIRVHSCFWHYSRVRLRGSIWRLLSNSFFGVY
jgi:hypothetical protein